MSNSTGKARRSAMLLCVVATATALCVSASAQERRSSSRIAAFDDVPPVAGPAATPVRTVPAPARPVRFGAVIPPPPHVAVAGRRRPGGTGDFAARPAAASRLAVNSAFGLRSDPITGSLRMHTGVDLQAAFGSSVGASMSGRVWFAGTRSGYGNLVVLDHGSGVATFYAHLSSIAVTSGEEVAAGQLIGYVGSTGRSTGPHLHYEVRANGHPVDPSSRISVSDGQIAVEGRAFGRAGTWDGPVELPRAPGGTSISVDLGEGADAGLVVDLE